MARNQVIIVRGAEGPSGTPGLVWRGEWASGTSYADNDVVFYRGSAWVATTDVAVDVAPPDDPDDTSSYWELAARGVRHQITVDDEAPDNPQVGDVWFQI